MSRARIRIWKTLLLLLVSDPPDAARLRAWRAAADLDTLPGELSGLLPLLHPHLAQSDPSDPWLPRLKGIDRRNHYANQLLLHALSGLADHLQNVQLPFAVIGLAYLSTYYPQPESRPVQLLSLLTTSEANPAIITHLKQLNWRQTGGYSSRAPVNYFQSPQEFRLHLHHRVLGEAPSAAGDAMFWSGLTRYSINGSELPTLSLSAHFLRTCLEAYRLGLPALVDAAVLIRSGRLDWLEIDAMAGQTGVSYLLVFILNLLKDAGADIPAQALLSLQKHPAGQRQRLYHQMALTAPDQRSRLQRLVIRLLIGRIGSQD